MDEENTNYNNYPKYVLFLTDGGDSQKSLTMEVLEKLNNKYSK